MKNTLLRIITLCISILAPASTQCMAAKATTTVLKKGISVLGTTLGLGLPLGLHIKNTIQRSKLQAQAKADPVKYCKDIGLNLRDPNEIEATFLKQCINDDTIQIKIAPSGNIFTSAIPAIAIENNVIIVSEMFLGQNKTLSSALIENDTELKSLYAGIIEHERTHVQDSHLKKRTILQNYMPFFTLGGSSYALKKLSPINRQSSILRHLGRFIAKTTGGLLFIPGINLYTQGKFNHYLEYEADQHISPKNRTAITNWFQKIDAINEQQFQQVHPIVAKIARVYFLSQHPTIPNRIARLQNNTKKS